MVRSGLPGRKALIRRFAPAPRPAPAVRPLPHEDWVRKCRPGRSALIMPFAGVIPCTGPWRYHPGRGRGGNPLPVGKNHTGPSPEPPRRSGGYRGDSPGGAQARGAGPDPALSRHHPIHRTVEVSPGEGLGRQPPLRRREPYRPFPGAPAQERGISWRWPGWGASPGGRPRSCSSPASSHSPDRGGITR